MTVLSLRFVVTCRDGSGPLVGLREVLEECGVGSESVSRLVTHDALHPGHLLGKSAAELESQVCLF